MTFLEFESLDGEDFAPADAWGLDETAPRPRAPSSGGSAPRSGSRAPSGGATPRSQPSPSSARPRASSTAGTQGRGGAGAQTRDHAGGSQRNGARTPGAAASPGRPQGGAAAPGGRAPAAQTSGRDGARPQPNGAAGAHRDGRSDGGRPPARRESGLDLSALANLPGLARQGFEIFQQAAPVVSQVASMFTGGGASAGGAAPPPAPAPAPDAGQPQAAAPPAPPYAPPEPAAMPAPTAAAPAPQWPAPQPAPQAAPAQQPSWPAPFPPQQSAPPGYPAPAYAPPGFAPGFPYGQMAPFGLPPQAFGQPAPFGGLPAARGPGGYPPGFGLPGPFGQVAAAAAPYLQSALGAAAGAVPGLDALAAALRQGQIPPLPGAPQHAAGAPAQNPFAATGLLGLMLSNPQLHQALQSAATYGAAGARAFGLRVPWGEEIRTVEVPLGAAVHTMHEVARHALRELNASTREDEAEVPEYLIGEEGELIVDPASAEERQALLVHLFKMDAHLAASETEAGEADPSEGEDASEAWARDAGFLD